MDNQTQPNWLRDAQEGARGTGIFLVPDVSSDQFGAMVALAVPELTYEECLRRGALTIGFKWVPTDVADFEAITQATRCGDPCAETCTMPGCICNRIRKQCVRAISLGR